MNEENTPAAEGEPEFISNDWAIGNTFQSLMALFAEGPSDHWDRKMWKILRDYQVQATPELASLRQRLAEAERKLAAVPASVAELLDKLQAAEARIAERERSGK